MDRVGAMVHRVVKEVDGAELVVVGEVEIRKGSRWRRMRMAYGDYTGNVKLSSRPRERCSVKFDRRDLSDTRRSEDPICMKRRRRAG